MKLNNQFAPSASDSNSVDNLLRLSNESPIIMMRWKNAPGWPVEFVSGNINKWGYSAEDFLSQKLVYESIVHPDDVKKMAEEASRTLAERKTQYEHIYRIVKADGSIVWIDDRTWIEYNFDGTPALISGVLIDITEIIRAERQNKIGRERLQLAINASNVGFYDYRIQTGDVYYSPEWKSQLGYSENEIVDHLDSWLAILHPDDKDAAVKKIETFINDPTAFQYESTFRLKRKDSGYSWIEAKGTAERDKKGNLLRLVGSHIDVTERVEQQTALQNALNDKNILLSEIHHRVKNNLTIISSILQLQLDRVESNSEKAIFLDTITKVKSISLIHEALYQNTTLTQIPIHEYIPKIASAIHDTFYDGEKNISLRFDLQEFMIPTNSAIPLGLLVNEVLTNSFKHAFKDTDEGIINISLDINKETAIIEIRDNGIGLPDPEARHKDSLGMQIIEGLAAQINSDLKIYNNGGAVVQLTLAAM